MCCFLVEFLLIVYVALRQPEAGDKLPPEDAATRLGDLLLIPTSFTTLDRLTLDMLNNADRECPKRIRSIAEIFSVMNGTHWERSILHSSSLIEKLS
jgi:hypothetical protein